MTHTRNRSNLTLLTFLTLLLASTLIATGCASTGTATSAAEAPEAPAKPDYTQEMGENGLPTPRALFSRSINATGGEEALRAVEYTTVKGKMAMPAMGMEGDMVLQTKAPNMMVMNIVLGGLGTMNTGFNGTHGWNDDPMSGPQLLEGRMLTEMKRQADLLAVFNYADTYPERETVEQTEFEGMQVYKVRLVDSDGVESTQYFDVDSSYLVGTVGVQTSPMGEAEITTILGDYKDFGAIKLPSNTTIKIMGMDIKQTITEVTFDPIEDAAFEPPASIQKLIDAQ